MGNFFGLLSDEIFIFIFIFLTLFLLLKKMLDIDSEACIKNNFFLLGFAFP